MRPHAKPHPRPRTTYALHRWLAPVLFALASFGLAQECSGVAFGGGSGTPDDPYLLATTAHFVSMTDHYESITGTSSSCWSAHFEMAGDVDLSSVDWVPIGSDSAYTITKYFDGVFDGNGHAIEGLTLERPNESDQAFFAQLNGTLRNVTFRNAMVSASDDAAVAVSFLEGALENVNVVNATVQSTGLAGGLVVTSQGGRFDDVTYEGDVVAGAGDAGGIAAVAASGTVAENVSVVGQIHGTDAVGGVFGNFAGDAIRGATVDGTITGQTTGSSDGTGGLLGRVGGGQVVEDVLIEGDVVGKKHVGGVFGNVRGSASALSARRVHVRADVEGDTQVGGLAGTLFEGTFTDASVGGSVTGDTAGALTGYVLDDLTVLERGVLHAAMDDTKANVGAVVGDVLGSNPVIVSSTFVDISASGVGGVAGNGDINDGVLTVSTTAAQALATFEAEGWSIATGDPVIRGDAEATWRLCEGEYPVIASVGLPDTCDPVDTGLTFAFDGASGELLRNVPFDVTLTLRDDAGPVIDGLLDSTIVLSATGGEVPGTLFVAGEDPEALPTATLAAGASSVTFENVVATGLSAEAGGDVQLVATGTSGTADGVTAAAGPASIRDVTMEVTASPTSIRADGSEAATIRVRLAAVADDAGVAGETMTFATDLGTFTDGGAPVGTTLTAETDADGVATARLVADGDAGTATVTVRCPGACPKTVTVELVGDATSVRAVPGDGKAWLYVGSLGADVVNLEVDRGEGFEALDPPSTASPVRLEGLENGVTYDLRVRGRTEGGGTLPPSDPVSVTPGPVAVPTAPVDVAEGAIAVGAAERRPDGRVALPLTVTVRNDTDVPWTDLWVVAPDAGDAWRIDRAEVEPGRVVRDGDRWNLRFDDTPLAPNATATVTFTLLERE